MDLTQLEAQLVSQDGPGPVQVVDHEDNVVDVQVHTDPPSYGR